MLEPVYFGFLSLVSGASGEQCDIEPDSRQAGNHMPEFKADGNVVMPFNTKGMFRGYIALEGDPVVALYGTN